MDKVAENPFIFNSILDTPKTTVWKYSRNYMLLSILF